MPGVGRHPSFGVRRSPLPYASCVGRRVPRCGHVPVKRAVRILFVEDQPAEVTKVERALRLGGIDCRLNAVGTQQAFLQELERAPPDVILSDAGVSAIDGLSALAIARQRRPEVPFIFVADPTGEEKVIESFQRGATDYILKSRLSDLASGIDRALQKSREHAARKEEQRDLGRLIDALLGFSRMGRAEMRQQRVNLAKIVQEARNQLHQEAEGRHIEWKIHSLPSVRADPFMLRQVFINLLSNAIKFTRNRPRAKVEIGAEDQKQAIVCFVRDNGVGFDMQYAGKLFGVFERLHRAGEFEGTGIGLANVRRIIHRHGGQTWAEGVVDDGATFYFSLPGLDGYAALALAQELCPGTPFIFVTGTMGEEVAIETLKKGATDYVLKHRLSRLVLSVSRALSEAKERGERRLAEKRLRESHEQLRSLSVHLQHVREAERTRIDREVHDELGQALTGLKLQLTWLASRLPKGLKALESQAQAMSQRIALEPGPQHRVLSHLPGSAHERHPPRGRHPGGRAVDGIRRHHRARDQGRRPGHLGGGNSQHQIHRPAGHARTGGAAGRRSARARRAGQGHHGVRADSPARHHTPQNPFA